VPRDEKDSELVLGLISAVCTDADEFTQAENNVKFHDFSHYFPTCYCKKATLFSSRAHQAY
jgi:hypothetical protein